MKLRLKVLIILGGMWAVVTLITYAYSRVALTNEYLRLEQKEVISDLEQTRNTLKSMMSSTQSTNKDWAQWDEAYQFMLDKNATFIRNNLAENSFENTKVNMLLFFTPAGKLLFGRNYDFGKKQFVSVPDDLVKYLETRQAHLSSTAQTNEVGIVNTSKGYVVLSASPILNGEGKGPSHGTLIMGYFFNEQLIKELSKIVNIKVSLTPLPLASPQPIFVSALAHLQKNGTDYIAPANQHIHGFALIRDIDNQPIGLLQITAPRDIYNQGIHTIDQYLAIVAIIGLLFLGTIWYLLKFFVLDRVISVSDQIRFIKTESKFSERLHSQGRDELGNMVNNINGLMEIIELSQEQLKHRIQLRTEELERLSALNKNLHSEMTQQKEIESQLREGEKVLRHMAYYDAMTGLPNRIYFHELLQNRLAKAERNLASFVMLFLDADKFKSINDTYGHDIGDKYLKHVAKQLRLCIKETDIAARLSGDEFILVFDGLIPNKAVIGEIIEKILQHISKPLILDDTRIDSTFSIGICVYPEDGKTIEELEKHADLAMYEAKKMAGTAYCYYMDIRKSETVS